jgi:hypothetical protein
VYEKPTFRQVDLEPRVGYVRESHTFPVPLVTSSPSRTSVLSQNWAGYREDELVRIDQIPITKLAQLKMLIRLK